MNLSSMSYGTTGPLAVARSVVPENSEKAYSTMWYVPGSASLKTHVSLVDGLPD